jgi:hypothetical protein
MVEVVHFGADNEHELNMESISGVEREIDKVLSKFTGINEHADRVLQDLSRSIESLKNELDTGKLRIMTQVTAHK